MTACPHPCTHARPAGGRRAGRDRDQGQRLDRRQLHQHRNHDCRQPVGGGGGVCDRHRRGACCVRLRRRRSRAARRQHSTAHRHSRRASLGQACPWCAQPTRPSTSCSTRRLTRAHPQEPPAARLGLVKGVEPSTVVVGKQFAYTLLATASGGDVSDVTLVDELPTGVVSTRVDPEGAGGGRAGLVAGLAALHMGARTLLPVSRAPALPAPAGDELLVCPSRAPLSRADAAARAPPCHRQQSARSPRRASL